MAGIDVLCAGSGFLPAYVLNIVFELARFVSCPLEKISHGCIEGAIGYG